MKRKFQVDIGSIQTFMETKEKKLKKLLFKSTEQPKDEKDYCNK